MTDFDSLLAKTDPERRLAALFAPQETRKRLFTLYAFYNEIAKIPDTVTEPVIGEMKLTWARDAVKDLYLDPPKVRRHDVYEALCELLQAPGAPEHKELVELIEARAADLGSGVFPSAKDRLDYVDRTAVGLMKIGARLLKPDVDLKGECGEALGAAGRLWGVVGLLRAFAPLTQAGRPPLTPEELDQAHITEAELVTGAKPDAARIALSPLVKEASRHSDMLARSCAALPSDIFPAIGYASLARGYLKAIRAIDDPYRHQSDRSMFGQNFRLVWGSLTGRI